MRRLVVLLCLLVSGGVIAQETETISPALQTYLETLEDITEGIRGLATLQEVDLHFPTREELLDYLNGQIDTALDDETVEKAMAFYVAFDFLPSDTDLRQEYLTLYGQQIAGFYDTDTKRMNVILLSGAAPKDKLPLLEQIVFVHEYTHALQDQHFGLEAYLEANEALDNDDRALAMLSLVEGDATVVMSIYTLRVAEQNPAGTLIQLLVGGLQAGNLTLPPGTSAIIAAELLFPYERGQVFVEALIKAGSGWQIVNEAYDRPPQSTEQILHPQKYLDGEAPIPVTLPEAETFPGTGWAIVREGVLGEFYLREYLDTLLTGSEATQAAAGWGGDAYRVFRHETTGAIAWMLQIAWDTRAEKDEFKASFDKFMAGRIGGRRQGDCQVSDEGRLCAVYTANTVQVTYLP